MSKASASTTHYKKPTKTRSSDKEVLVQQTKRLIPSKKTKSSDKTPKMQPEPAPSQPLPTEKEEDTIDLGQYSSDNDDSSDEGSNDEGPDIPAVDITSLPTVAKDDATVARRLERAKKQKKLSNEPPGAVYLGRIPHGFYEDEMKGYFSQFGDVTRLRLARNKKTGKSKHYAFIEFESRPVAEIVAETMDNYLLLGHILKCKVLEDAEIHPRLWVGSNRKFRPTHVDRVERQTFNKARTEEQRVKAEHKLLKRQEEKKRKLAEMGIDYDMSEIEYKKVR